MPGTNLGNTSIFLAMFPIFTLLELTQFMSVIIERAETTTYCYESYYFTKQSEINFMAFHSSITEISQKKLSLHSFELKPEMIM